MWIHHTDEPCRRMANRVGHAFGHDIKGKPSGRTCHLNRVALHRHML